MSAFWRVPFTSSPDVSEYSRECDTFTSKPCRGPLPNPYQLPDRFTSPWVSYPPNSHDLTSPCLLVSSARLRPRGVTRPERGLLPWWTALVKRDLRSSQQAFGMRGFLLSGVCKTHQPPPKKREYRRKKG
ncbi:hypothetical protein BO82DRAFT_97018 [Aspergillus uvarum CBS 121591]|uniref:Uncharacterized protein n=1 Tax=Aspergillus uvarum CBS 121591 TaxID=1448315 RepID=A0A319DNS9_9EURO|nr:hypothetical protein BO82DRAFT_97018 [Aspergillus uvarum CBS 121591]PYH80952.1 hypothetical protein BO82DRAFT_97018 [Aspergillus uvarum CBS 121591]